MSADLEPRVAGRGYPPADGPPALSPLGGRTWTVAGGSDFRRTGGGMPDAHITVPLRGGVDTAPQETGHPAAESLRGRPTNSPDVPCIGGRPREPHHSTGAARLVAGSAEHGGELERVSIGGGEAGEHHPSRVHLLVWSRTCPKRIAGSGTVSALPDRLSSSLRCHPDVDLRLFWSFRDFELGDDPAGEDLVARLRELLVGGELGLLVVGKVEEPWGSGHAHLIGERASPAIPLRGGAR